MAKVKAPFTIKGTLDDLVFYNTEFGNIVRQKSDKHFTAETLRTNPAFEKLKNCNLEFTHVAKKAGVFHKLARSFNDLAAVGAYMGRVTRMLKAMLDYDTEHAPGSRCLVKALEQREAQERMLGFESNIKRSLSLVLKASYTFDMASLTLVLDAFSAEEQLVWPEGATRVEFQLATALWNVGKNQFDTHYSDAVVLAKYADRQRIELCAAAPAGEGLLLSFILIAFSYQEGGKKMYLGRKWNTNTLLAVRRELIIDN